MIEQIKNLRVRIDGLAQLTKELRPFEHKGFTPIYEQFSEGTDGELTKESVIYLKTNSKEIEKAVDNLYLAKAWLGKVLGELGESTPYANDGKRKTVEDIEPTADTDLLIGKSLKEGWLVDDNLEVWAKKSHIEKVDWLREEIEKICKFESRLHLMLRAIARTYFIYSHKHLCEAKFWLGFELQRIKEQENN